MPMDCFTECADVRSGACSARQQLRRAGRRFLRIIFYPDAMQTTLLTYMFAATGAFPDGGYGRGVHPIALSPASRSSPVAGCSKPPPLRCTRPDAPFDRHIGNNGMFYAQPKAEAVLLRQPSRRLALRPCPAGT